MAAIIVFIVVVSLFIIIGVLVLKAFLGERIEINYARGKIYGWYDADILCSESFSSEMSAEEILNIKNKVKEKLKKQVIKYKEVNK